MWGFFSVASLLELFAPIAARLIARQRPDSCGPDQTRYSFSFLNRVAGPMPRMAAALVRLPSTESTTLRTSASIDTNEPKRDGHLKSDDFFAVDTFPTLSFVSTAVTSKRDGQYVVEGDLTIRDVTKRIQLPTTFLGAAKDPWGNQKLAFEAEITINRKDFGLNWNTALETGGFLVGDEVKVSLSIQAA